MYGIRPDARSDYLCLYQAKCQIKENVELLVSRSDRIRYPENGFWSISNLFKFLPPKHQLVLTTVDQRKF